MTRDPVGSKLDRVQLADWAIVNQVNFYILETRTRVIVKQLVLTDEQFESIEELEVFLRMLGRMHGDQFESESRELKEALQVFADCLETIVEGIRGNAG